MSDKSQSLERGLAILELIDAEGAGLGVREIGRRLALSPTIVQRLVHSLVSSNFLMKDVETQKYALGYRALSLGSSLLSEDNLISASMPVLSKLARDMEVNAFLSVNASGRLVYVLALQSNGPISLRVSPGASAAFHSTAMGKAILADETPERVKSILGAGPFERRTDKTLTDHDALAAELEKVRAQGYSVSNEENLPGVFSTGAAVRNASGHTIAGISTAFAPSLQPQVQLSHLIHQTLVAAREISQNLGCPEQFLVARATLKAVAGDAS